MSSTRLDTPFLDGGIRSTNFFNGRILSGEDMQRDRDAEHAIDERLGRALGAGIAYGFDVTANALGGSSVQDPVLTVGPGLALNRCGQTLELDRKVDVALLKPTVAGTGAAQVFGGFNVCAPPDDGVYVAGTGVYVLTISPAQGRQGLAPVSGLNTGIAPCNAKELVSGVRFRLLRVKALTNAELADEAHLRNVAAYKFFLAEGAGTTRAQDPFGSPQPLALTDPLSTDSEVALALVHWTATGGLRWVDLWSVRRRVAQAAAHSSHLADRPRLQLGEALLLQFQEQLRAPWSNPAPQQAVAADHFRYLPPVGLLPIVGIGAPRAFEAATFFAGVTTRGPIVLEGADVPDLLNASFAAPPIDLTEKVLVWQYLVRENLQASGGSNPTQPYLLFATGHLPPRGAARLDVSRAGFSNTAIF